MTKYFLKELQIEGFRGINNEGRPLVLKFSPSSVNSIFGENGRGKSSIYDALSYAINGEIPRLEGLPAAEKANSYYNNKFHTKNTADILLVLSSDDGTPDVQIRVIRDAKGTRTVTSPTGHSAPEDFLQNLRSEVVLLDYTTFASFVENTPLERGRTFSGLIGYGKLSEFRQTLETLAGSWSEADFGIEQLESQLNTQRTLKRDAVKVLQVAYKALLSKELSDSWNAAGLAQEAWAVVAKVPLISNHFASTDIFTVDFKVIKQEIRNAEGGEKHDQLAAAVKEIQQLEALAPEAGEEAEKQALARLTAKREYALAQTQGSLLKQINESALAMLESGEWADDTKCPLCESDLKGKSLKGIVHTCLQGYQEVSNLEKTISDELEGHQWAKRGKLLERQFAAEKIDFSTPLAAFKTKNTTDNMMACTSAFAALNELRLKRFDDLTTTKNTLEKDLPPSLIDLTEKVASVESIRDALQKYAKAENEEGKIAVKLQVRRGWCSFISLASQTFSSAEVALSTKVVSDLETRYREINQQITANTEIVPKLKKATREELHLRLEKFGSAGDTSALSVLSESYRNALAISVFLSAAERQRIGTARFVVLDDVTSSFDAGHQWEVMEVLRRLNFSSTNPTGPQFILLSHDGLLEKYFDRQASTGADWRHQRLQGVASTGIIATNNQHAGQLGTKARALLSKGSSDQAKPLVRQYLEYSLLEIIRRVNIPVPFDFAIREDKQMVQNALDAISAAVDLYNKTGTLILDPAQVANKNVLVPQIAANFVSHYSSASTASISPAVFVGLLNKVDDFVDSFKYSCTCNGGAQRRFFDTLASKPKGCKC